MPKIESSRASKTPRRRKPLPRCFKDLTPSKHFNPRTFFYELVWKALLTRRTGERVRPRFPKLAPGQAALTWIGHASFLAQFTDLNVLIDPNFANWLFLLKRVRRAGLKIQDLSAFTVILHDGSADNVGGHQVWCELDARILQRNSLSQGAHQQGLTNTRHTFQQDVSSR